MTETNYNNLSASELLDLRDSIDEAINPNKVKLLNEIIEERRVSIKQQLEEGRLNYKYSTLFPRVAAMLLDGYIIVLIRWVEAAFLKNTSGLLHKVPQFLFMADIVLYSILFHLFFGQTIGKKLVGIKVVNYDNEAQISYKQAILRDFFPLLAMIYLCFAKDLNNVDLISAHKIMALVFFVWYFVEIITMLFNKKRRAIQDFIARTISVRN